MEVWIPRRRVLILSDSEWRRPTGMAFQLLYFIPSGGERMLWTIFAILLILWLLGFSLHVGGALIHLLLVVGLVVLVINLVSGRRSAV